MHASEGPSTTPLFKRSVFAWRAGFLAEKALRQQLNAEEGVTAATETAAATPPKIVRPGRFAGRR
jgi:hypothetical protein